MPEHDFRSPRLYVDAPLSGGRAVALEREQSN
jgi:16S rRNA (uracil1498-N3)-methyltransferase